MLKNLTRMFLAGAAGLAFIAWIVAMASSFAARTAQALPLYAQRTGLLCGQCHVSPSGGGPRTAFGRAFAANGHRLPGKSRRSDRSRSGQDYGPGYGYGPGMMGHHGPGMYGRGMYGPGMIGGYGGMMGGYNR
jgi:hypothetical protein